MRHRMRGDVLPLMWVGTSYYELLSNPGKWQYAATWNNSPVRQPTLYPNIRVEHCYDDLHAGPPYKSGGPFNKWSFYTNAGIPQGSGVYFSRPYGSTRYKYDGGFCSVIPLTNADFTVPFNHKDPGNPVSMPAGSHTWGDVSSYGPTGWARFRPGRSTADAGIFLGEIRDVPRMLKTTARGFYEAYKGRFGRNPKGNLKKAADHWLNHQFGWAPFVSDLRKFYKTWFNADRVIRQIVEQNGQWQRRVGTVLTSKDSYVFFDRAFTDMSQSYLMPALGDIYFEAGLPNKGWMTCTRVTSQRVWFVGRFRYYIPHIESVEWKKSAVQKLFGAELSPSLVWELTPWSWLVDWFSNVGDVIANISNTGLSENLAAKYAYIMGETRADIDFRVKIRTSPPVDVAFTYSLSRKVRVEANPFGFGLTWDGLSPRQWSILSALGITRMH